MILEFDIDKGNSLTSTYPSDYDWSHFREKNIADMCLPDGAHIHEMDWTYLLLHSTKKPSVPQKKPLVDKRRSINTAIDPEALKNLEHEETIEEEPQIYFGLAFFKNKSDKTVKRGAVQKSLLIVSKTPHFDQYCQILQYAMNYFFEHKPKHFLKTLYEAFKKPIQGKMNLFDTSFDLNYTQLGEDEFEGTSLIQLVQRFGVDTMYLWYTLILEQRILFTGQPAHLVGQCCISSPLLVAPLKGFTPIISPYIALTGFEFLHRKQYICGSTNSIFENKTELYDMMASFSTGIVRKSKSKLSTYDKEFIMNVISGMHKGEKWVRDQFYNFTKIFLDSVSTGNYKNQQHKLLGEPFKLSKLYENYITKNKEKDTQQNSKSPTKLIAKLQTGVKMDDNQKKQFLWELLQCLVDLNSIDELCENNVIHDITHMLDSNSAQVRKYAVATLAQIAISIKGQISLIQHNIIPRVVVMLHDPMPNVASAAAYCLLKISGLYIGVSCLVKKRVPKMLLDIICSNEDNLVLKISTAETLLQIYKMDPSCPIVGKDSIKQMLKRTSDTNFRSLLTQLLDVWGEPRIHVKIDESVQSRLLSLRSGGLDVRTSATSLLLSDAAQDENLLLQIIATGGLQVLIENMKGTTREEPLSRLSMAILCLMADTSMGRSAILGNNTIPAILEECKITEFPLHLYYVYRFLEICCQHENTAQQLIELNGLSHLIQSILTYSEKPKLLTLTLPCLGALKYLLLLNSHLMEDRDILLPLKKLHVKIKESKSSLSHSFLFDDKEFFTLLSSVVSIMDSNVSDVSDESDALLSATEDFLDSVIGRKRRMRRKDLLDLIEEEELENTPPLTAKEDDIMAMADSLLEDLEDDEPMDKHVDELLAGLTDRPPPTPRSPGPLIGKLTPLEQDDDKWDDILNLTDSIIADAPNSTV